MKNEWKWDSTRSRMIFGSVKRGLFNFPIGHYNKEEKEAS